MAKRLQNHAKIQNVAGKICPFSNLIQHHPICCNIPTGWPKLCACNMLCPTMLQDVAFRANARNIVGPNMLRVFTHHVVCCCVLLRLVGSCWMKFETGQTSEPSSANISIVSRSSKRGPTMLRRRTRTTCHVSTQIHAKKKSTWRRRWKTSQSPLYSHLKTQHVVTCCERLHTSANIAQQDTTLLGPAFARASSI